VTADPPEVDRLPTPPSQLPAPGFELDIVEDLVVFRLRWEVNPLRPRRYPHGRYRFDAPRNGAEYPVAYASYTDHGAFAEVYGDTQLISRREANRRLRKDPPHDRHLRGARSPTAGRLSVPSSPSAARGQRLRAWRGG
jgi:hypothetical protein